LISKSSPCFYLLACYCFICLVRSSSLLATLALGDLYLFLDFLILSSLLAFGDLCCFMDFFFFFFIDSLLDDLGLFFLSIFYFFYSADLILPEELELDSLLLLYLRLGFFLCTIISYVFLILMLGSDSDELSLFFFVITVYGASNFVFRYFLCLSPDRIEPVELLLLSDSLDSPRLIFLSISFIDSPLSILIRFCILNTLK